MRKMIGATCIVLLLNSSTSAFAGTYSVLFRFQDEREGTRPLSGVAVDADGTLYGTTTATGLNKCGTIFALIQPGPGDTAWTQKTLHQNRGSSECYPLATPSFQGDFVVGTMYGENYAPGEMFRARKTGGTYKILHTFEDEDGQNPTAGVLVGTDGQLLYGTTRTGGRFRCPGFTSARGVLYQTGASGGYRVLHNFGGNTGAFPEGDLAYGPDGAIYGTATSKCERYGFGTIFRLSTDGAFTVLYHFKPSAVPTVSNPTGRLAVGPDGTLYGTTTDGGKDDAGVVYSLAPGTAGGPWTFKVIHEFAQRSEGTHPDGLVRNDSGDLFGTLQDQGPQGAGSLFRLGPSKAGGEWIFAGLHDFARKSPDGSSPNGDLALKGGVLYGTTSQGGSFALRPYGSGTVFSYALR